jgi:hypothetical protein
MDLLGANSLEVLRKLEQQKSNERYYGFPLAAIVAIAVKLVSPKSLSKGNRLIA